MIRSVLAMAIVSTALFAGCSSQSKTPPPPPVKTGFLSTYVNLEQVDDNSWRYLDRNGRLGRYDKFILPPVQTTIPDNAEPVQKGAGDPAWNIRAAQDYMRQALVDAISDRYQVVDTPAWDVADVRVMLTDAYRLEGRVFMSMESEILDAVSNVQIGALVESQLGGDNGWNKSEAMAIMDAWAQRFRTVLDEAHGGS